MQSPVCVIPRGAVSWLAAVFVATLLAGCGSPVRLMPTPASFRTGDVDPFAQAGSVIEKILTHLGLQARAPPRAPARGQALQAA
jgi:hypothetical protein